MGGGDGGASQKLKKAVKKIFAASFCNRQQSHVSPVTLRLSSSMEPESTPSSNKNLCTICLDPLDYISGSKAIFTAQCSHSFHFACITSNVTHGSLTCPVCRAHWTQLPRRPPPAASRRSFYHYNNLINSDHISTQTRLSFSLFAHPQVNGTYLRVKLENQPPTDLILVANLKRTQSETLAKQAMVMVVSSLRPIDRLAIVTCPSSDSSSTLRRMTPCGKRAALRTIDQMSYNSHTDSIIDLEKGVEILENRVRENPRSCILHLTDVSSKPRRFFPIAVHQFGFDGCNGLIIREFEEFLARTLGGGVEDVEVRVGEQKNMVVRIGELRGGEERNIPLWIGESRCVWLTYSYRDGGCIRSGEVVVDEQGGGSDCEDGFAGGGLRNYGGNWGTNLHGYRIQG